MHVFTSVCIAHMATPNMGQYLKGYWLKEFPQHNRSFSDSLQTQRLKEVSLAYS